MNIPPEVAFVIGVLVTLLIFANKILGSEKVEGAK